MSGRALLAVGAAVLAMLASGCGVSLSGVKQGHGVSATATVAGATVGTPTRQPTAALPARPAGVVDVDGQTSGSLTHAVVATMRSGVTVDVRDQGTATAFGELCAGTIDAVDSTSPITPDEWDTCSAHGVRPVQFVVAADGIVAVTRGGSDVGVDCLTVGQVQDAFRAGSAIDNWRQLGGYDLRLETTGLGPNTDAFDLFGRDVVGVDPPSLTLLRGSYHPQKTDDAVRTQIVGSPAMQRSAELAAQAAHDVAALHAAIARKEAYVRQLRARVAKDESDGAVQLTQDEQALSTASGQYEALLRDLRSAIRFANSTRAAAAALRASAGKLGFVSFDYGEFYEDQLRPIEIDASRSTTSPAVHNCIYPSQETITSGTYPLASQFLITVSLAGLHRPAVAQFITAYVDHAQALAAQAGLVPMTNAEIATQRAWITRPNTAPVIVYPSPAQRAAAARRAEQRAAQGRRRAATAAAAAQQRAAARASARQAAQTAESADSSAQPTVTPAAPETSAGSSTGSSTVSPTAATPDTSAPTSAPQPAG